MSSPAAAPARRADDGSDLGLVTALLLFAALLAALGASWLERVRK